MGNFHTEAEFVKAVQDLQTGLADLAKRPPNPVPVFTSSTLPPAPSVPYLIVYNLTALRGQMSDGTTWQNLW